ncbi:MAG: hypothetical protein DMG96_12705 [Acidobacteria bacterium]|nr:MAG: hypothetical protein DMG96_12705 [Acidobacteriota bacterium]
MLPLMAIIGETVIFLETFSDSAQLFFLGSVFLLGGFAIRGVRSAIVQYRTSFLPKQQPPPEQICTSNS